MPTIPFHPPGVTYNGLHATPNPNVAQVNADLTTFPTAARFVRGSKTRRAGMPAANASRDRSPSPMFSASTK